MLIRVIPSPSLPGQRRGDSALGIHLPPWGCAGMLQSSSCLPWPQAGLSHTGSVTVTQPDSPALTRAEPGEAPWHTLLPGDSLPLQNCSWGHHPRSPSMGGACGDTVTLSDQEQRVFSCPLKGKMGDLH